jgi:RNA polymerase sigma factor (sigma-70 family)
MPGPSHSEQPVASLKRLAARAQRGDHAAFELLVRRLGPGMKRVLLRWTGGHAELSEELAHSAWVAVWNVLRDGRYDAKRAAISTFVYAVAHKLWLRHLRRTQRAPLSYGVLDEMLAETDGADSPAATLQAAELLDAVRACLHTDGAPFSLSEDERRIVIGLACKESERSLADQLGVAPSTVHARKALAYKKLRRCLAAKGFSPERIERGRLSREQPNG